MSKCIQKPAISLKYRARLHKFYDMTLVIGARCVDGVVLVADRKLTINSGSSAGDIE
jgi:20S proteasome alpha/beta subunit